MDKTVYHPTSNFEKVGDFLYLLQESKRFDRTGKPLEHNDVTIRIEQHRGGYNPMPEDVKKRLVEHLKKAANEFLFIETGYPTK
ncbi:MAG: hypothetical protein GY804_09155 [Alphaproteobacteria bacterium]|nr:hypothetical protein [Alphaproteobacteria bacterium]